MYLDYCAAKICENIKIRINKNWSWYQKQTLSILIKLVGFMT
jgi:hypothetical protein